MLQDIINGLSLGGVYAMIAVGFALIFSVLKFSNFSHGYSMMVCTYAGYFIAIHITRNFWLGLLATGCFAGCLGMLIDFVGFRHLRKKKGNPLLFFVSSITIGMLLEALIVLLFPVNIFTYPKYFPKSYIRVGEITLIVNDMLMMGMTVIMLTFILVILYRTRLGISIRALSMDDSTASLMGINVPLVISATFFVAYMTAGMAGMFLGITQTITPTINRVMSKVVVASVLGGLGTVSGAVIGAFLVAMLEVILIRIPGIGSGLTPAVLFLLSVVFLILRPQGISGKFTVEKV